MTIELVDESDVRKDQEKKHKLNPELRLIDKSEKKSWLDVVDESEVRKDPKIELVDKSDVIEEHKVEKKVKKVKKPELEFVVKDRIIDCERQRSGMTNNCVLCKELTRDRFDKCVNKYGGF